MPQIKKTKIELKAQRDALQRFERFLPMLQLKKQQLQAEIQSVHLAVEKNRAEANSLVSASRTWSALMAEDPARLTSLTALESVETSEDNIAGVIIPVFKSAVFQSEELDLFETPPWLEEARDLIKALAALLIKRRILERQNALLEEELRVTSQRVNLFEKVKIPESKEKIRVIKIFMGDLMTAEVARGKAAKKVGKREDAA
ncbi:MAG: V-type ATP synthase subunit D [Kiritimatiellia bacterium]